MGETLPPTHIIAEMACSHEGDVSLGKVIIDGAGHSGADSIQFQVWQVAKMVVPDHNDRELLESIELTPKEWTSLAEHVRSNFPNMEIIGCVYDMPSVDLTEKIGVDAYKVHTADLGNRAFVKRVASTNKRIDLSVGASTIEEIEAAIGWIQDTSDSQIWLMYGHQNFPTLPIDVHLDYMMRLQSHFGLPLGYQDHTDAEDAGTFWLPAFALGLGVTILEKHITHDRSLKGVDYQAALNPDEFAEFVRMARMVEEGRGDQRFPRPFSESEEKYRIYSKKSIVAARNLTAGEVVQEKDLLFMRANELGYPPNKIDDLLGKQLTKNIEHYSFVTPEEVE